MTCHKTRGWTERKDAREELLKQWASGRYTLKGTHWCQEHKAYHLTSKPTTTGNNYSYRD